MRILYLHQYFNTPDMPGSSRSYEMARHFVDQGHIVHIVSSWRESGTQRDQWSNQIDGINIHWISVKYSNSMQFAARIYAFFKFAIKSAIKAYSIKADVVFATSTPLTISIPAIYVARRQKIPMVFEVRDLWPELPIAMGVLKNPVLQLFAKYLECFTYKNSFSIITLSPGMKDGVVRAGYPSKNIAVIPNVSDIKTFFVDKSLGENFRLKRKWLGDRPLLIYTGTFGKVNGVSYLVDLATQLLMLNSDIAILLIGSGSEYENIRDKARISNVLNINLFIEDSLPKKEIPAALSASTMASVLFLDLVEMRNNSANKFFDALAAGKPVFINFGGWIHDIVVSRKCGLAMWKISMKEVAEELDSRMHNLAWLEMASKASIQLARERFSRDMLSMQLLCILQEAVDGNPGRASLYSLGEYL